MPVLIGWCWVAAVVLLVSLVAHLSTFLGIDPMAAWPGVMFIHLAIFPPFIAALCYASLSSSEGPMRNWARWMGCTANWPGFRARRLSKKGLRNCPQEKIHKLE